MEEDKVVGIELPCNILIVGCTTVGKTHLTKRLLRGELKDDIDYLVIVSTTNDISDDFDEKEFPSGDHISKFNSSADVERVIEDLCVSQKQIMKTFGRKEMPSIMVVIDDCTNTRALAFKGYLDKMSVKLRHFNISTMLLVQRLASAPRTYRLNCKYSILFSCSNFTELEKYIQEFVSKKYHKKLREMVISIYDEPYNFILSKNFSKKITERLYLNGTKLIKLEEE